MSSYFSIPYNFRIEITTSDHCDYERHFRCEVTRNKSSNYRKMLSVSSPYLLCFCHKTDEPRLYKHIGVVLSYIVITKSLSRSIESIFPCFFFYTKFSTKNSWNFVTFVLILISADQWRTKYAGPDSWASEFCCLVLRAELSQCVCEKIKKVVVVNLWNVICETRNFRKTFKIRIRQNQWEDERMSKFGRIYRASRCHSNVYVSVLIIFPFF